MFFSFISCLGRIFRLLAPDCTKVKTNQHLNKFDRSFSLKSKYVHEFVDFREPHGRINDDRQDLPQAKIENIRFKVEIVQILGQIFAQIPNLCIQYSNFGLKVSTPDSPVSSIFTTFRLVSVLKSYFSWIFSFMCFCSPTDGAKVKI